MKQVNFCIVLTPCHKSAPWWTAVLPFLFQAFSLPPHALFFTSDPVLRLLLVVAHLFLDLCCAQCKSFPSALCLCVSSTTSVTSK